MVLTWVVLAGLSAPAAPPPDEVAPLHKVEGPTVRLPFRAPDRPASAVDAVELWVSADRGRSWAQSGKVTWDEKEFAADVRKEVEFRAPKPGEYWFATRVLYADGRVVPADVENLQPDQRVAVAAGSDGPAVSRKPGDVAELDHELTRLELDLIRAEMKRLAGAGEFTPAVADRIDHLRARLRRLRPGPGPDDLRVDPPPPNVRPENVRPEPPRVR